MGPPFVNAEQPSCLSPANRRSWVVYVWRSGWFPMVYFGMVQQHCSEGLLVRSLISLGSGWVHTFQNLKICSSLPPLPPFVLCQAQNYCSLAESAWEQENAWRYYSPIFPCFCACQCKQHRRIRILFFLTLAFFKKKISPYLFWKTVCAAVGFERKMALLMFEMFKGRHCFQREQRALMELCSTQLIKDRSLPPTSLFSF